MLEALSVMGRELMLERHELSAEEEVRLSMDAGHCCPNCNGPITVGDHEAAGICSDCYWATTEH